MKEVAVMVYADAIRILTENPATAALLAVLMALFSALYGTSETTKFGMTLVILLIIADWIPGFSAAKKDNIDTSRYGIEGLFRSMLILLLPAIAHFVDLFFMTLGLASFFTIAALARHLFKSVVANVIRVGWTQWVPTTALDKLSKWAADEIRSKDSRAQQRYDEVHKGGEE